MADPALGIPGFPVTDFATLLSQLATQADPMSMGGAAQMPTIPNSGPTPPTIPGGGGSLAYSPANTPAIPPDGASPAALPGVGPARTEAEPANFFEVLGSDQFEAMLAEQAANARARTRAERIAADRLRGQSERVTDSATQYHGAAKKMEADLDALERERNESIRLATSDNPLDRIELIGKQILNPRSFTRDGRISRAAEMSQILAMRGQIHNVNLTEIQAQTASILADRDAAMIQGETAFERLQTRVTALATMQQGLALTESMRSAALSKQTADTLDTALSLPSDSLGYHTIGNFKYSRTELETRRRAMQELDLINSLTLDHTNSQAVDAYQRLVIPKLSVDELQEIRDNDFMHNGMMMNPALIRTELAQKKNEQGERVAEAWNRSLSSNNMLQQEYTRAKDTVERLQDSFPATSQLGAAMVRYKTRVGAVASFGEKSPDSIEVRMQQMAELATAEQEFIGAVEREAKVQAKGDSRLEPILKNQLLGIPPDPAMLFEYGRVQFGANKAFVRGFGTEVGVKLQREAEKRFMELKGDQGNYGLNSVDTKGLREMAFDDAFDNITQDGGLAALNGAHLRLAARKDSPLAQAEIYGAEAQEIESRATIIASQRVAADYGLDAEKLEAVLAEREGDADITRGTGQEIRAEFNKTLVFAEYDLMELKEPGLGGRYAKWYRDNALQESLQVNERLHKESATLFAGATQDRYLEASNLWTVADESATGRSNQLATEALTQLQAPNTVFAAAIEATTEIPNDMKSRLWIEIIEPTFAQINQNRLSREEANQLIIGALTAGHPTDKALNSAAKKVVRAIPYTLDAIQAINQTIQSNVVTRRGMFVPRGSQGQPTGRFADSEPGPTPAQQVLPWLPDPRR